MLRVVCVALVGSVVAVLGPVNPATPAVSTYLCIGYDACSASGHAHAGYKKAGKQMWWRMYSGHNCTNYAAYRVVKNGYSDQRPWVGSGNATNWGVAMKSITDQTPRVGAIAWWRANSPGVGSAGHVAYVEQVVSATEIIISEDSWGGDFSWRRVTKESTRWPTGFIHFNDQAIQNTSPPALSGAPVVGSTLSTTLGAWKPAKVATAVQWYADGVAISGATGSTLLLTPAERKKQISVRVTASSRGLASAAATSGSAKVALGEFDTLATPAVEGVPEVGEVLTATAAELAPAPKHLRVQWFADEAPIPDATRWKLTLDEELLDARVHAVVSAKASGYRWAEVPTDPTDPVLAGSVVAEVSPAVAGEPMVGQTLSVTPGRFVPQTAEVHHSWLRDGVEMATGTTYRLTRSDLGARITLRTEATKDKWRTATSDVVAAAHVRTSAKVKVAPKPRKRAALVRVRVRAPGANPVAGKVEIKVGKQTTTVKLVDGRARVRFDGLVRGNRPVRVTFLGSADVQEATTLDKVRVR